MCSVQDGRDRLLKEESAYTLSEVRQCMKCNSPAVANARTKDPFCKVCFNNYFIHRFRSTFGKSRLVSTGEKVLLAFSGGQSSRVMLSLSEEGLSHQVHKKLRFVPTVIYVDEGALLGLSFEERCHLLGEVLNIAVQSGFSVLFTQLEQVYGSYEVYGIDSLRCLTSEDSSAATLTEHSAIVSSGTPNVTEGNQAPETPESRKRFHQCIMDFTSKRRNLSLETKLKDMFDTTKTQTAKENFVLSLRQRLLSEVAKKGSFRKVLIGVNATQLAVRLLSNVAQGRGATLPLDVGFADSRAHDVMILRPIREFPSTEIATYAALNQLNTVSLPSLTDKSTDTSSIDHLTTTFINGLQANFPSTVSTVFRTGDKLTVEASAETTNWPSCALCQAPVTHTADSSVFSHLAPSEPKQEFWKNLCYGCRLTIKDTDSDVDTLPPFVATEGWQI